MRHLIRLPLPRSFAVGFCQIPWSADDVPEAALGSWAYHREYGQLYVHTLQMDQHHWYYEFDGDYSYTEGDVVGCGLNMQTGEGYRTRNGRRLHSSRLRPFILHF